MCLISSFIWCNFHNVFVHVEPSKICAKNIFPHFLAIFALFELQKCLIFSSLILDLSSKWLLGAFNIHVMYFEHKKIIFICIFLDLLTNIKIYLKF